MNKRNKIALIITIVLIALLVGYNLAVKDGAFEPRPSEQTLTIDDYENAQETLTRLGYESIESLDILSDGSEDDERFLTTLKNVTSKIDTVDKESDMFDAHLSVAVYLNLLGAQDEAIDQYEYLLTKRPQSSTVHNNLAWIYIDQGEYKTAEQLFKENIENNPKFANWYVNLGDLYQSFMPEKKDEIPELFETGHEQQPLDTEFILYLADYYESEEQYEKALEWYLKALEVNPNMQYAKDSAASMRDKLGQ